MEIRKIQPQWVNEFMTAEIIDGKRIANTVKDEVAAAVLQRTAAGFPPPGLATVLVGNDPPSHIHVRNKTKTCEKLGIRSFSHLLPEDTTQEVLENLIGQLNSNPDVHGILIQLPLPEHLEPYHLLSLIDPRKDVDGIHPVNAGLLSRKESTPWFIPCTPAGILYQIHSIEPDITGMEAVVIGRSAIVGMPTAQLLCRNNATVTICHSKTVDLPKICRRADIVIVAVGQQNMVKGSWIKPGAIVIDVGINHVPDNSDPRGYHLTGDTDFESILPIAKAITPVPGGVGPMTIAMLMQNTYNAALRFD